MIEEILHRALAEAHADTGQPGAHAELVEALSALDPGELRILADAVRLVAR